MKPKLTECSKFQKCSAALCPLDPDWQSRTMIREDTVCSYMSEAVKNGAETRFKGVTDEAIYLQARDVLPQMMSSSNTLKKRLQRAALTRSRRDAVQRFIARSTDIRKGSLAREASLSLAA